MATVIVSVSIKDQAFPAGTLGGNYAYDILQSGTSIKHQESDQLSITFVDVPPGDYAARAQRLDSSGSPLGIAVTMAFVVPQPTVNVSVPDVVTVTLA
jgi:hypothetical protein